MEILIKEFKSFDFKWIEFYLKRSTNHFTLTSSSSIRSHSAISPPNSIDPLETLPCVSIILMIHASSFSAFSTDNSNPCPCNLTEFLPSQTPHQIILVWFKQEASLMTSECIRLLLWKKAVCKGMGSLSASGSGLVGERNRFRSNRLS